MGGRDFVFQTGETLEVVTPKKKKKKNQIPLDALDYQIYRECSLGETLRETLKELIEVIYSLFSI